MAWEQVAQANISSSGIQGNVWKTLDELPVGTEAYLSFQALGIGPLMDAWGVETIVRGVFWAKGVDIKVVDCYGEGLNTGYIRFTGSPVGVLAILVALAPVLTALLYLGIVVVVGLFIWKAVGVDEEVKMTTFTGSITRLTTVKPIYALGSYPELLVDFYIQAHDLSWWESEWHAYLLALDPSNNQIAQAFRSDFTPPLFQNWPNPDIRVVQNVKLPLVVPLTPEGLNVGVQLYGSTTIWQPEGFIEERDLLIVPTPAFTLLSVDVLTKQVQKAGLVSVSVTWSGGPAYLRLDLKRSPWVFPPYTWYEGSWQTVSSSPAVVYCPVPGDWPINEWLDIKLMRQGVEGPIWEKPDAVQIVMIPTTPPTTPPAPPPEEKKTDWTPLLIGGGLGALLLAIAVGSQRREQ